jgi:hypothetical protein
MTAVTDAALARLSASIQNSSSMKLSLAGNRRALDQEDVPAPDVLEHPDEEVSLRELDGLGRAQRAAEVVGDRPAENLAGRAGEQQQLVVHVLCWTRRGSENESASQRCIGRSSAKPRSRFKKIPTETGSTCTGPTVSRCRITASKIGRSRSGPLEKYSSSVIAGAHSCDCRVRPK